MIATDARLRATDRGPDTEERAALLARAGRFDEAYECYWAVANALWAALKEAEFSARLDGLAPMSSTPARPTCSAKDLKAMRAEWSRIREAMRAVYTPRVA